MSEETSNGSGKSPHAEFKDMADDMVAMKILDLIDKSPHVSQSVIRFHTGLATGLVHSYMRKIINKGWVKAKQVSARRWLYYLTPEGFIEKSRLTLDYLSRTMHDYRKAQELVKENLQKCAENGWRRIVVAGDNALAEILSLYIKASDELELVAIIADSGNSEEVANEAIQSYKDADEIQCDRILVCDMSYVKWLEKRGRKINDQKLHFLVGS